MLMGQITFKMLDKVTTDKRAEQHMAWAEEQAEKLRNGYLNLLVSDEPPR